MDPSTHYSSLQDHPESQELWMEICINKSQSGLDYY